MAPKERNAALLKQESSTVSTITCTEDYDSETTKVVTPKDAAPYVICSSANEFVNPTTPPDTTPKQVLQELNLSVGQSLVTYDSKLIRWIFQFFDKLLFRWWEHVFFRLYQKHIPLIVKRVLIFGGWKLYRPLHKLILGRSTGMHPSQSLEYHALTTIMWWTRLFPVSPERFRFSLSQLYTCCPNIVQAPRIVHVKESILPLLKKEQPNYNIPSVQMDHTTVKGMYLYHSPSGYSEYAIFWVFGGAYLSGDVQGNSAAADWVRRKCQMDVFLPACKFYQALVFHVAFLHCQIQKHAPNQPLLLQ